MDTATTTTAPRTELWMILRDRKYLAYLMEDRGVSQRKLAKIAGWKAHSYLGRLLAGDVKTLETVPALRIAHFFGVGVDSLFLVRASHSEEHDVTKDAA